VEAILPGGQMYHLDLSDVDGSGPATLSLQPVDLGGIPLAASDLTPPPAANTPGLQLSPIGVDGIVRIDAPAGTVEPHAYVTIGNRSRRSLEPVDVMANASGGFVAYALADSADTVCVLIADAAGNHGPDACLQVNSSKATTDASKPRLKTGLLAPSPNPSHGDVQISFALAQAGRITIDVLDVAGRRVRRVLNGQLEAGQHAILWDGRNDRAQRVSAGFYFVRYTAEGRNFVKRVVRIASP
jgi:hypothetical protein